MNLSDFINKHQKAPVEEYPNNVVTHIPSPLVSCRVSTYNHERYIRQCLDGIMMQKTDFDYEVVIGEDESSDATRDICIEYAQKHPDKIRLFLHSRRNNIAINGKPSAKFQSTYTSGHCRGKYQTLCEGDDFWIDPLKLQRQADYLENNPADNVCSTRTLVIRQAYPFINPPVSLTCIDLQFLLRGWVTVNTVTLMYRSELVKDPADWTDGLVSGDWCLLVRLLSDGSLCAVLPEITSVYRIHAGGMWHGIHRNKAAKMQHIVDKLRAYLHVAPSPYKAAIEREISILTALTEFHRKVGISKILSALVYTIVCRGFAARFFQLSAKKMFPKKLVQQDVAT